MHVGNHGQFDIHSFFLHDLTSVLFQNTPSLISGIHLPLPIAVLHTLKSSRCYLQQVLRSICVRLDWATVLGYYPFGSQGRSRRPWGHGKTYDLLGVTRKQFCFNFFPGWVLNNRFRGAVRSSVIMVGVSLLCPNTLFMWDQETRSLAHVRYFHM